MRKPEFVLENKAHRILWDFEIQIYNNPNQKTRSNDNLQKKENLPYRELCRPSWPQWKSKKAKRETSTSTMPEN